jgi:hypothetical protein
MISTKEIKNIFKNKSSLSNDELIKFKTDVINKKQSTQQKINACVSMFNTVMCDMANSLTKNLPNDQTISIYSGVVQNIVKTKPNEIISLFLMNVYKNDEYRENLLALNDNFFLNTDYSNLPASVRINMDMVFQFKKSWNLINVELQTFIKQSMCSLVKICDQYVQSKGDLLDLNDIEKEL